LAARKVTPAESTVAVVWASSISPLNCEASNARGGVTGEAQGCGVVGGGVRGGHGEWGGAAAQGASGLWRVGKPLTSTW